MGVLMDHLPLVVAISSFFIIATLCGVAVMSISARSKQKEVVQKIKEGGVRRVVTDAEQGEGFLKRLGRRFRGLFKIMGAAGAKQEEASLGTGLSGTRLECVRAGFRNESAPAILLGAKSFFALVFPAVVLIVAMSVRKAFPVQMMFTACTAAAIAGFILPKFWLNWKVNNRKAKFIEGLPDALDLLVICVEAGMGLDAAINRVADEMRNRSPVLAEELRLLNLELRAGMLRRDALKNLSQRINVEDVASLTTLLIQADKFGTSIAQTLRIYSDTLRTKRFQRAEEIAGKLPVKLLIPLILFIFPSLFVAIMAPAAIRVYHLLVK